MLTLSLSDPIEKKNLRVLNTEYEKTLPNEYLKRAIGFALLFQKRHQGVIHFDYANYLKTHYFDFNHSQMLLSQLRFKTSYLSYCNDILTRVCQMQNEVNKYQNLTLFAFYINDDREPVSLKNLLDEEWLKSHAIQHQLRVENITFNDNFQILTIINKMVEEYHEELDWVD